MSLCHWVFLIMTKLTTHAEERKQLKLFQQKMADKSRAVKGPAHHLKIKINFFGTCRCKIHQYRPECQRYFHSGNAATVASVRSSKLLLEFKSELTVGFRYWSYHPGFALEKIKPTKAFPNGAPQSQS